MKNSLLARLGILATVITTTPQVNADLLQLTTTGGQYLDYIQHEGFSFMRPADAFNTFWDFCEPYNCYGYETPGVEQYMSFGTSGSLSDSLLSAEYTVSLNALPVDLYTRTFPASDANGQVSRYIYDWSSDPSFFENYPVDKSFGFQMTDRYYDYAFSNWTGTTTYTYSGLFDPSDIPAGYDVRIETLIDVIFSSSWINDEGRPVYFSESIYSNVFTDSFSESIVLDRSLQNYPGLGSDGGSYDIWVTNRFTFVESAAAVPIPPALPLLASGLIALWRVGRRR